MSYAVWITKEGIKVIDAIEIASKENAEILFSVLRNGADNAVPYIDGALDVDLFAELVASASRIDVNEFTKKSFAATLGVLAALATLPLGPAAALAADQMFSEAFEQAYESANEWSIQLNWVPIFDLIDSARGVNQFDAVGTVDARTNTSFNSARAVVLQRDPLILDLDGDGLELSAASGNTLFDHNADGIKTGTGWARPDDGFLVRDLNGNGSIDSGRELFGVDTVKSNGQLASQGFDALADLDSNGDGQITSADAAWGQLQVWRDTNQDGISQAGELSGLDALGITRLGLNGSATGPQLGRARWRRGRRRAQTEQRCGAVHHVHWWGGQRHHDGRRLQRHLCVQPGRWLGHHHRLRHARHEQHLPGLAQLRSGHHRRGSVVLSLRQ
ncbi:hypothetical protein ACWKW4_01740 [Hydrogenophaga borbori]